MLPNFQWVGGRLKAEGSSGPFWTSSHRLGFLCHSPSFFRLVLQHHELFVPFLPASLIFPLSSDILVAHTVPNFPHPCAVILKKNDRRTSRNLPRKRAPAASPLPASRGGHAYPCLAVINFAISNQLLSDEMKFCEASTDEVVLC